MKRAIYPGSFDPVTNGHIDIVERATKVFDELIVAVLSNSAKKTLFSNDERVKMIESLVAHLPNVKVMKFEGLLIDFAEQVDARIIVRGLRAVSDFEYEFQICSTYKIERPEIEIVFLTTDLKYLYLSSTVVREYASYGSDISKFVPESIIPLIMDKYKDNTNKQGE